ncbi:hypothetical protein DL93DRAFT_2169088 [Clavulina sp. PMI_390]|nr:hypothetical protein DL93DRAFT_2169088 [Clavulina sp. PMI_390]
MLKALGVAQPSLNIRLEERSYFLRPNPEPELTPTEDVVVKGSLILNLPKPKKIKSISVKVLGHYNILFPTFAYEASQVPLVEVQLQSSKDERLYEKGEHVFSFALIVPSSSPTFDRSSYGRIIHTVNAVAFGEGLTGGSNIEASVPVYLVANPAPIGETSDLNVRVEGFREELGPYSMATAAQHLTVGGLLHFDVLLASVPVRTQIVSVSATLLAHYTLRSIKRPNQPPQYATKKTRLFIFDAINPPCTDTRMLVGDSEGCITPTGTLAMGTPFGPVETASSTSSAGSASGDRAGTASASTAPSVNSVEGSSSWASTDSNSVTGAVIPSTGGSSSSSAGSSRGRSLGFGSSASSSDRSTSRTSPSVTPSSSSRRNSSSMSPSASRGATSTAASSSSATSAPIPIEYTLISPLHHPSTTPPPSAINPKGKESVIPMTTVDPGGSYQVTHIARLPNDDIIRPSTLPGTKTPIETKHELILEIRFNSVDENGQRGKLMVLRSEHAITLSSCCCMISSLLVPAYSEALNTPPEDSATHWSAWENKCSQCICMSSKEDLIDQYRLADERLRQEHAQRLSRETAGGMTTVISWDNLRGPKFEYSPLERAQG